jgi:hypothetical protein
MFATKRISGCASIGFAGAEVARESKNRVVASDRCDFQPQSCGAGFMPAMIRGSNWRA